MADWPHGRLMPTTTITPWSEESLGQLYGNAGAPASQAYAQNRSVFFPFRLAVHRTAVKLFLVNGATINGNIDVGIYTSEFQRIVSAGSTAQSGANAIQEFDITDTDLSPGLYYLGFSGNSATGTVFTLLPTDELSLHTPLYSLASSFPLADSPAVVVSTGSNPGPILCGIAFATLI